WAAASTCRMRRPTPSFFPTPWPITPRQRPRRCTASPVRWGSLIHQPPRLCTSWQSRLTRPWPCAISGCSDPTSIALRTLPPLNPTGIPGLSTATEYAACFKRRTKAWPLANFAEAALQHSRAHECFCYGIDMKIGKETIPRSAICTSNEDTIVVRGKDLAQDLIGQVSFTDYFHLLVTGREPTPAATAVLNATLVAIAEHGLVPSVQASRMTLA